MTHTLTYPQLAAPLTGYYGAPWEDWWMGYPLGHNQAQVLPGEHSNILMKGTNADEAELEQSVNHTCNRTDTCNLCCQAWSDDY